MIIILSIVAIVVAVKVLWFLFNCEAEVRRDYDKPYFLGARWWRAKFGWLLPKRHHNM